MREEQTRLQTLQAVDSTIVDVKDELERLAQNVREVESRIAEKKTQTEEKAKEIKELERQYSDLEKMQYLEKERLKKVSGRLQGTGKQHPYAYTANQKEKEKAKKDIETIEENMLKLMQGIEDQKGTLEKFKAESEELVVKLAEAASTAEQQTKSLAIRQSELETERKSLIGGIEPRALAAYQRIHVRFPRNSVVLAQDEFCLGCHMHIPPQMYNELQRGEKLITCPACQRVLLFMPPAEEEAQKEAASG